MDLGNFAVSTLNQYLKGTDFPATKEEVARNAEGTVLRRTCSPRSGT